MLVVFTGNGKGKTTAALGAAVRAIGRGQKVLMVQFIKGSWRSGEDLLTSHFPVLTSHFQLKKMGLGFVGILGDSLPIEKHKEAAQKALLYIEEQAKDFDLIILDEVNVAVSLNLLTVSEVLKVVDKFIAEKIIILTGRDAPVEFIDRADLVTEMKEVKHPFQSGKQGKINVEF